MIVRGELKLDLCHPLLQDTVKQIAKGGNIVVLESSPLTVNISAHPVKLGNSPQVVALSVAARRIAEDIGVFSTLFFSTETHRYSVMLAFMEKGAINA